MRCNPLGWLWGIIPVAMLSWIVVMTEHERIQADLKARAAEALSKSEMTWAGPAFSGRDGIVSGRAFTEGDPGKALQTVSNVWGVRIVEDRTGMIEAVKDYLWTAALRERKLFLSGHVPSEAVRQQVLAAGKAAFPNRPIEDRMQLARGVPNLGQWLEGVRFGYAQLTKLKEGGHVDLDGLSLVVEGESNDAPSYTAVKTALARNLPSGVRLKTDRVTAAVVTPYTWAAAHRGSQVELTGHVPGERQRDEVFASAKRAFPKATVVDRMTIAAGEPSGWQNAVNSALTRLGQLEEGNASLSDTQLNIAGLADKEGTAETVRGALRTEAPQGFRVSEQIRFREPSIKPVSPFVTGAEVQAQAVILTGFVPSEEARAAVLETIRSRLPGRRIDDRMQIAAGAPEGWQACTQAGLAGLVRLGTGSTIALRDRQLELTGRTADKAVADDVPASVRSAAGQNCSTQFRITFDAPPPPTAGPAPAPAPSLDDTRLKAEAEARRRAAAAAVAAEAEAKKQAELARQRAEEAAKLAAARRMADAGRCQRELAEVIRSGIITFQRASAEIDPKSLPTLNRLAVIANSCPDAQIEVAGHTDAEGTPERNKRLSDRRSLAVYDILVKAGVSPSRLAANGYGETQPVAPNDTPENRARNRRIEFNVKPN